MDTVTKWLSKEEWKSFTVTRGSQNTLSPPPLFLSQLLLHYCVGLLLRTFKELIKLFVNQIKKHHHGEHADWFTKKVLQLSLYRSVHLVFSVLWSVHFFNDLFLSISLKCTAWSRLRCQGSRALISRSRERSRSISSWPSAPLGSWVFMLNSTLRIVKCHMCQFWWSFVTGWVVHVHYG